jgi:hypothetical protein
VFAGVFGDGDGGLLASVRLLSDWYSESCISWSLEVGLSCIVLLYHSRALKTLGRGVVPRCHASVQIQQEMEERMEIV